LAAAEPPYSRKNQTEAIYFIFKDNERNRVVIVAQIGNLQGLVDIRSDESGKAAVAARQSKMGITPPLNQAETSVRSRETAKLQTGSSD
jgi:hypothetical protein